MRLLATLALALAAAEPALAQTDPVHEAVEAYALYQSDVTALIEADIDSAAAMDAALSLAARHDPAQVARGWIAYGGLTAAQSPAFVAGVRSRVRAAGRAPVIRQLRRDMTYARRRPPGSNEAIQLVLSASAADGARMVAAGHRYRGIGEAMDVSAWSSTDRNARDTALRVREGRAIAPELAAHIRVGVQTATPLSNPDAFGGARFWDAVANRESPAPPNLPWRANSERAGIVDRMLTIGGLVIVEATAQERARVNAVLDEPRTRECLELEWLQFRQCASVAHDSNEDAHCLARHGLTRPGQCFASLARAP